MQTLKKILEEIDIKVAGSMGKKREGLLEAQDIIRKHMNDGWIPIDKRLPDVGERIIVCNKKGFRCEAMMTKKGKYFQYGLELGELFGQKIVAWRPLPEPYCPEMENN